jgi:hypothetical protein
VLDYWRDLWGQHMIELDAACETTALTVRPEEGSIGLDDGLVRR